ncbi:exopolysaccharide biosynthesis protein [Lacimicrobium alkaliphilum]|uniref:non-specific protein-tyrosine kinase n=2 Tax=Lacimicrobium alkaliphilum TaxID=1526571 RepID=A0A0U2ZMV6_9ALTE|nr:exopolysaccharide biosynthesis protein [Lacimicrobium alkaliphilum]
MSTPEAAMAKAKSEQQARVEEQPKAAPQPAKPKAQATTAATRAPAPKTSSRKSDDDDKNRLVLELNLNEEDFVTPSSNRSRVSEEFRAIKRKVLNNAFGPLSQTLNNPNIIMVTSSNPGEGKTYTAVNLALSIALEQDKTVLLVDADVLRPNVMRTLGIDAAPDGLMEYLLGETDDVADVMYHTNVEKLRVIPAGKSHHLSTELLASEKMEETVQEFASRYPDRVVIVDTPPLLGINETAVLANLAGQALIVVEESKTKLADLNSAVETLDPDMAKGFVVNKSLRLRSGEHGYGYYYAGRR